MTMDPLACNGWLSSAEQLHVDCHLWTGIIGRYTIGVVCKETVIFGAVCLFFVPTVQTVFVPVFMQTNRRGQFTQRHHKHLLCQILTLVYVQQTLTRNQYNWSTVGIAGLLRCSFMYHILQVGMRYFNKRTNKYHNPIVNLDKLWTLVGEEVLPTPCQR